MQVAVQFLSFVSNGGCVLDLWNLKVGDRVRTNEGAIAEVMNNSEDGEWVKVKYLYVVGQSNLVGTEDLCHADEIAERMGNA